MKLESELGRLREAGLLRLSATVPEPEYLFQHALLQEAAYASLTKQDRKRLHLAVGEVLEQIYPDRLESLAPVLAQHFARADDDDRALTYFLLAGEHALKRFALPEAVTHLTDAVRLAPRVGAPEARIYRARGVAHEAMGDFDNARADQESALQTALVVHDRRAEWQALIDLGMLWAERDYRKTGDYFQRAFDLAHELDDPATLAHSLNHLGNWCVNVEQQLDARRYHQEALEIFERLGDRVGIAQTLDFLGMATSLGGAFVQGMEYVQRAVPLLRELDDRQRLVSSLTTLGLRGLSEESDVMVLPSRSIAEAEADVAQALTVTREIGWRSAEAFALIVLSLCQAPRGDFSGALDSAEKAAQIAQEIGHRQWLTFALGALGEIYAELFALETARQHLERAFALAHEIGSLHWTRTICGFLASVCLRQGDRPRAQAVLDSTPRPDDPPQTLGQRLVSASRAELALANGDWQAALDIADQLIAYAERGAEPAGRNIFRVSMLRGQALGRLQRYGEAEAALTAARDMSAAQGALAMLWKVHVALAVHYRSAGRAGESESSLAQARAIVQDLEGRIGDPSLRETFASGAKRLIDDASAG